MFCSRCGSEQRARARRCTQCGAVLRRPWLPILAGALVVAGVVTIIGIRVGTHFLSVARLNDRLEEAVGKDAGFTETILKIEVESGSMTFAELFKLCEQSIDARTAIIVELRGLYPDIDSRLRSTLIDHLTAENELVRQKVAFYRKQLALSTAVDLYLDELNDVPTSGYGWDYHTTRLASLKKETMEAVAEMATEGTQFVETYKTLVARENSLAKQMHEAGLRFVRVFEKYEAQNVEKAQETISDAQSLFS
jgi:hypothetical protein